MFYLSPSVRPSYDDLDEMIRSAGGSVVRDMPSLQQLNEKYLLDERKTVRSSRSLGLQLDSLSDFSLKTYRVSPTNTWSSAPRATCASSDP